MHYVGIDLGTTNSVICSYDGISTPRVWKSPEQNDVTPSAIYIGKRGNRYYGYKAYNRLAVDEKNVAVLFKRFLVTSAKFDFLDSGISLSPEECSAEILGVLFGYLPEEIRNASDVGTVITVPAAFSQVKKEATIEAAHMAGIGRVTAALTLKAKADESLNFNIWEGEIETPYQKTARNPLALAIGVCMKTFCFKLYHSDHNNALMRQINAAGLIYNHCIALHKRYYRLYGKYLDKSQLQRHLVRLKRHNRFAYIREIGSQAVQDVTDRIDRAYNLYFANLKRKKKASPPKFKRVRSYKSFTLKQTGGKLDEVRGKIRIGKKWYGYFQSRKIEGKVKTVTVKRDAVGDIYVYLVCDVQCEQVELRTGKSVGFDLGLKTFLTGSDGHDVRSPNFFMMNIKAIRRKSRKLSRRQKGSRNRERYRKELARAYRKMENQRKDFHFKTARKLCEEYACICLETLNMEGMARRYGRKVHSLGFSEFVKILEYEAAKFGTEIILLPQTYPSSQLCHVCGYKNPEVKNLKLREWDCPQYRTHHDRDRNAAINIHRAGASARSGGVVRPASAGSVGNARIPCL